MERYLIDIPKKASRISSADFIKIARGRRKRRGDVHYQPKMPPDGTILHFVVPGPPHGYYAQAGRNKYAMSGSHRERTESYRSYQEKVKEYARLAKIPLPLKATKEFPIFIRTIAYFKNGVHPDPENVRKGVSDALFMGSKGGDKHCGGSFDFPQYDSESPRVEVTIQFLTRSEANKVHYSETVSNEKGICDGTLRTKHILQSKLHRHSRGARATWEDHVLGIQQRT